MHFIPATLVLLAGNFMLFRTVMLYTLCLIFPAGNLKDLREKKLNFEKVRENDMKDYGHLME